MVHCRPSVIISWLVVSSLLSLVVACTPRIVVRSNPGPSDKGIRYYRPKPFLKVEPAEVAIDKTRASIDPSLVRISLVYLPDFGEEYAIDVRAGLGSANVGIKLQDGWNLTEISQNLDSQTDENLKALGSILSAAGDVVPTAKSTDASPHAFTVNATSVPFGFYESVVSRDSHGCKRLYGFRYVGFMPYSSCPVDMGGAQQACCGDPANPLYGLTFANGQMVFRPLDSIASSDAEAVPAEAVNDDKPTGSASGASTKPRLAKPVATTTALNPEQLSIELRSHLRGLGFEIGEVRVVRKDDAGLQLNIQVPSHHSDLDLRLSAEAWLDTRLGDQVHYDIQMQPMP